MGVSGTLTGWAGANPTLPFYGGGGTITAHPSYPIVGESTHIEVIVGNDGDAPATNVRVKVSFNDWGVTFMGWQEIGTVTVASIPAGGSATASVDHVFLSPAHTCVEAIIVGADEDTNPADDRGQINLEVIHAGDTFSYGVPVRNEGDVALQLVIRGGCAEKDPAGQAPDPCRPIELEAQVPPGGEIRVPVELDLRGVAPGVVMDYQVDAVDQFGNHNHIVLRVARTTAKQLKADALELAVELLDDMPTRALRNRVENLIRHLQFALRVRAWLGANQLLPNGGAQVLAQEAVAAQHALDLLRARLPLEAKVRLNSLVRLLVDADRILAETALAGAPELAEEDVVEAAAWLQAGDVAREQGRYGRAIEAYRRAWHHAVH